MSLVLKSFFLCFHLHPDYHCLLNFIIVIFIQINSFIDRFLIVFSLNRFILYPFLYSRLVYLTQYLVQEYRLILATDFSSCQFFFVFLQLQFLIGFFIVYLFHLYHLIFSIFSLILFCF